MGVEVEVESLSKSFGKQLIWADVSLTLPEGEISVMLGPSGTGKSGSEQPRPPRRRIAGE